MTTHIKHPVSCNTYIAEGEVQFHYPDTSLVFSSRDTNLYVIDRDDQTYDVFADGKFTETLVEYLGSDLYNTFLEDFGHAGFWICSDYDTECAIIDDLPSV